MKICLFHKYSPPFTFDTKFMGGAEKVALKLAELFAAKGHETLLINSVNRRFTDEGHKVTFVGTDKGIFNYLLLGKRYSYGRHVLNGLYHAPKMLDVLHVTSEGYVLAFQKFFRVKPRLKVLHLHEDPPSVIDRKILFKNLANRILKETDVFIAPSKFVAKRLGEIYDISPSSIKVIYNGLDLQRSASIAPHREKNIILYAGAIVPQKGVHILLEAANLLKNEVLDFEIWIAGSSRLWPGEYRDYELYLRSLADRTEGRVKHLGLLNEDNLAHVYKRASVCVIPSIVDEACPLIALESMAAGVPVVASNVGSFPELVEDQKTGLLVPKEDAYALAAAIKKILMNDQLREDFGKNSEEKAKSFSWDLTASQMLQTYEEYLPP